MGNSSVSVESERIFRNGRMSPNFTDLAASLHELIKKGTKFVWTEEHNAAVRKQKEAAAIHCELQIFEIGSETRLEVDASKYAVGAVLKQKDSKQK